MSPETSQLSVLHFRVNGREVEAQPGITLAAALGNAGILALQTDKAGARRGFLCGMGSCFECTVRITHGETTRTVRACREPMRNGLEVWIDG